MKHHGFTLLEIVIVIAVIAILAGVLAFNWGNIFDKADGASALSDAQSLTNELLASLLNDHGDDSADLLIFVQKSDDIFVFGYDSSQTKLLTYRSSPIANGTLSAKKAELIKTLLENCAINVDDRYWNAERQFLWRVPKNLDPLLEQTQFKGSTSIAVYALYEILPVNFDAEAVHPSSCEHPNLTELKAHTADCITPGYATCFLCNDCGAILKEKTTEGSAEKTYDSIDKREVNQATDEGKTHNYYYIQNNASEESGKYTHTAKCRLCDYSTPEDCSFGNNKFGNKCVCGRENSKESGETASGWQTIGDLLYFNGQPFTGINDGDLGESGLYYDTGRLADGTCNGLPFSEGRLVSDLPGTSEDGAPLNTLTSNPDGESLHTKTMVYRYTLYPCPDGSYTIKLPEGYRLVGLRQGDRSAFGGALTPESLIEAYARYYKTTFQTTDPFSIPYSSDCTAYEKLSIPNFSLSDYLLLRYVSGLTVTGETTALRSVFTDKDDGTAYGAYAFPEGEKSGLIIYSDSAGIVSCCTYHTREGFVPEIKQVSNRSSGVSVANLYWKVAHNKAGNSVSVYQNDTLCKTFTFHSENVTGLSLADAIAEAKEALERTPREALLAMLAMPTDNQQKTTKKQLPMRDCSELVALFQQAFWKCAEFTFECHGESYPLDALTETELAQLMVDGMLRVRIPTSYAHSPDPKDRDRPYMNDPLLGPILELVIEKTD